MMLNLTQYLKQKKITPYAYHVALLFSLPLAFIVFYQWHYYYPVAVIFTHLSFIALCVVGIFAVKFLLYRHITHQKTVLWMSAVFYGSFYFSLIIYYALVLVSLNAWNRVITIEFINAYLNQAQFFLNAIGVSMPVVIVGLAALYVALVLAAYLFHKKINDLPKSVAKKTPLVSILVSTIVLFCGYHLYDYCISSGHHSKEPIKLTLHSGKPKSQQNHDAKLGYGTNHALNTLEDEARKNYQVRASTNKKNLIIFIVDALRPDHMGLYEYQRETTPNISALTATKKTTLFNNAHSVCGETTCAHAGFMASRFVHQLPDNLFTLQEVLKRNDYRTRFIISGDHVNFHNIREVYGQVDDYYDGSMAKGYYFNDDAITLHKTASLPKWDGKPTMLHYHILSAHQVGKKEPAFAQYLPSESYLGKRNGKTETKFTNFYDNGVLQADAVIHQLLNTLENKQYLDNALVIITADHGEALGEKSFFMHTNSVIEPVLNIPLIMIDYSQKSQQIEINPNFISLVDLAPSILHTLALNIPETWVGKPFQTQHFRRYTFFEMTPYKGLYDHQDDQNLWKYWTNINTGEEFVFNLSNDPSEKNNLVWQVPATLKKSWRDATQFSVTQQH